jgi:hypothetical protein
MEGGTMTNQEGIIALRAKLAEAHARSEANSLRGPRRTLIISADDSSEMVKSGFRIDRLNQSVGVLMAYGYDLNTLAEFFFRLHDHKGILCAYPRKEIPSDLAKELIRAWGVHEEEDVEFILPGARGYSVIERKGGVSKPFILESEHDHKGINDGVMIRVDPKALYDLQFEARRYWDQSHLTLDQATWCYTHLPEMPFVFGNCAFFKNDDDAVSFKLSCN